MSNGSICNLLLLNDDVTPMDFVVTVLQDVFDLDFDDACKLMLRVHHEGKAVCGTYERKEAETKVADTLALASERNHPLKCVLEVAR
jgi:ATP-dependent Clp protease adaptor protein ClpS